MDTLALVQSGLQWSYILICFLVIWYGVALLLSVWHLLVSKCPVTVVARDAFKFAAAWGIGWIVVVVGRLTTLG